MSESTSGNQSPPKTPTMSRHTRSGSAGLVNPRRQQNPAARAAAQQLARVMAHRKADDESSGEEDDDLLPPLDLSTPRGFNRSNPPAIDLDLIDQSSIQPTSIVQTNMSVKSSPMIPLIKPSPKIDVTSLPSKAPIVGRREKRMTLDMGNKILREPVHPSRSSSTLQDEIDVLQEENENLLEKLRLVEERCEEAETRAKQLEKQASLKAAVVERSVSKDEAIAALEMEAKSAKDKVTSVVEHLLEAESEIKSLRTAAQKMILNQEEMEELILKRCWLARYWKLCVQHGIHSDIAEEKNEYWSSLAPLPLEVVLSAGIKARDGPSLGKADHDGEENIESMLLVEKGLRELVSLKVEEAALLSMARHRCSYIKGSLFSSEESNPAEAFELSKEECEDVRFKQAWLTYIWRRVYNHGLEEDIADDRLQFWINESKKMPNSHDAVEVERGFLELKKLGIESQLWEACGRGG